LQIDNMKTDFLYGLKQVCKLIKLILNTQHEPS
jgi:hypothetical protein